LHAACPRHQTPAPGRASSPPWTAPPACACSALTRPLPASGRRRGCALAETGRRVRVNDLWTAAATANQLPVVTQDDDFEPAEGSAGLIVIKV